MIMVIKNIKYLSKKLPGFNKAHWLLRIPLAIVFIQQGISKLPVTTEGAEAFGLPYFVWFFVAWSELFAGIGLLIGGLIEKHWVSDIITRFSGIVMVGIVSGVIIISEPETFLDVLLHDNLHVFLYVVGLFFVLKGNRVS
jgi:putative oxidoreductase